MRCSRSPALLLAVLMLFGCSGGASSPAIPIDGRILGVTPGDLVPADPGESFTFSAEFDGTLKRIAWDFGDGVMPGTSTAENPTVVAGPIGTYHGTVSAWFWPDLPKVTRPFTYRILQVGAAPAGLTITPTDSLLASHKSIRFRATVDTPDEVERWQWSFTGPVTPQITTNSVVVLTVDAAHAIGATVTASNRVGETTVQRDYGVRPSPHFSFKSRFAPSEKVNGYDELQVSPLENEFFKIPLLSEPAGGLPAQFAFLGGPDFFFQKWHPAGTSWSGTLRGCDSWACGDPLPFDIPAPSPGTSLSWQSADIDTANPFPNTTADLAPYPTIAILKERVGIFFLGRDGYRFYRAKTAEPREPADWSEHIAIPLADMDFDAGVACHLGTLGDRWVIDTRGLLHPDHHGLLISRDGTPEAASDWRPALRFRELVGSKESIATAETPDGRLAMLWARHQEPFVDDHFTVCVSSPDVFDDTAWTWINWDRTTRLLDAPAQLVVAGDGLPMVFWIEQGPARAVWSATAPAWDAPAENWELDIIASRDRRDSAALQVAASAEQISVVWVDDRFNSDVLKQGIHCLVSSVPRPQLASEWSSVAPPIGAQPADLAIAGSHLILAGSYLTVTDSLAPATPNDWSFEAALPIRFHAHGGEVLVAGDSHLYAISFSTRDPAPINRVFGPLVIDWVAIP